MLFTADFFEADAIRIAMARHLGRFAENNNSELLVTQNAEV